MSKQNLNKFCHLCHFIFSHFNFWQSSESDPVNSFSRIISILSATLGMAGAGPGSPGRVLLLKLLILTFFV